MDTVYLVRFKWRNSEQSAAQSRSAEAVTGSNSSQLSYFMDVAQDGGNFLPDMVHTPFAEIVRAVSGVLVVQGEVRREKSNKVGKIRRNMWKNMVEKKRVFFGKERWNFPAGKD